MDENTYRFWSVLLSAATPVMVALLAALLALLATRWEGKKAEDRARAAEARAGLLRSLAETHDEFMRSLYAAANALRPAGSSPIPEPSRSFQADLLGEATALGSVIRLQTQFASRRAGSGLSESDLAALAEATEGLRRAFSQQAALIRQGKDPIAMSPGDIAPFIYEGMERLRKHTG
jgi:hypothetical protein